MIYFKDITLDNLNHDLTFHLRVKRVNLNRIEISLVENCSPECTEGCLLWLHTISDQNDVLTLMLATDQQPATLYQR